MSRLGVALHPPCDSHSSTVWQHPREGGRGLRGPSGPFPVMQAPSGGLHHTTRSRMVRDSVPLENVVKRIRKLFCQDIATPRAVLTGGLVPCTEQRLQLDLPQGTHVMVLGEGQDAILSAGDQIGCRMTGQATCHLCL